MFAIQHRWDENLANNLGWTRDWHWCLFGNDGVEDTLEYVRDHAKATTFATEGLARAELAELVDSGCEFRVAPLPVHPAGGGATGGAAGGTGGGEGSRGTDR